MAEFWKVLKGLLYILFVAFTLGAAWGACQVGATLVRRLAE